MYGQKKKVTKHVGKIAETAAKQYLQQHGLRFIEKNYTCRQGEIDLIMQDAEQLIFIEVKYRSNTNYGSGFDVVDKKKQQKIILAARYYLHQHRLTETTSSRFDVVSIEPDKNNTEHINWLKNAFYCE